MSINSAVVGVAAEKIQKVKPKKASLDNKDSDRAGVFVASVIGLCGLAYILEGMYESGIDNVFSGTILELLVGFSALIGWFFMMLSGLSSIFPIYIDAFGGHYRTLFLRKKS